MDLFGKKKKAAQKAQDEKKAASDRPKSMPPRPPSKAEDNIKNRQAQNPNEERPKGASPRPYNPPSPKDIKAAEIRKKAAEISQSKEQQDPRKVEGDKYPRPPMSIKDKQGLDPKQRTNLPPDRPKPLVPKTEDSKQQQDPKQRTNLPPDRPKYLPPLKSPTSREAGKYPPSPSPQEKGMDYGRPPGASPMYPNPQEGQIKKARKDHFWDGHKKPMGGPTGYQPFNPSQDIKSQYPRPSDPDEGGSMAKKPMRPKGPNSPGGAFPNSQNLYNENLSDKYGAGK